MKLASLQETVTVSGSSPTVDVENTKVGARLSQEILTAVPTSRTIFGSTTVLPGMTMGRQDPGGLNAATSTGMVAHGASNYNLNYYGVTADTPQNYGSMYYMDFGSAEEVSVDTAAMGAEVGGGGGANINVIPKSGGMVARVAVLASGDGSNLQAIIDACAEQRLTAEVVAVVSDRPDVRRPGARRARPASRRSPSPRRRGEPRGDYDARLADVVAGFEPDCVVLAGWMRILTMSFLGWFPDAVVNLHPALPGELPGVDAIERAWHEARAGDAHAHRRDGAPRARRGRRRRPGARPRSTVPHRSWRRHARRRSPPASTPPSTTCSSTTARHLCSHRQEVTTT